MSASIDIAAAWPSSDRYATRATRARLVLGIVALAVAILYAGTIAASGGELMLVPPLAVAVVVVLVIAHPVVGVYLLFGRTTGWSGVIDVVQAADVVIAPPQDTALLPVSPARRPSWRERPRRYPCTLAPQAGAVLIR